MSGADACFFCELFLEKREDREDQLLPMNQNAWTEGREEGKKGVQCEWSADYVDDRGM